MGVRLTFKTPDNMWDMSGSYVNINVPFISKYEWHPFSLYTHASKPGFSCVCMAVGGDWTTALHEQTAFDTRRPIWVQGPFVSPFTATCAKADNLILVATGIGITPCIGVLERFGDARSMTIVW